MSRILITGAESFVGKNLIENSIYKEIKEISLFDNSPEDIDFHKYDVVIHLVAIVHQSKGIPEKEYFGINRDLCLNVANCAKNSGVKQFIFLSTVKVYGEYVPNSEPWNENSICVPVDSYGKSKYEAELYLKKMETDSFIVSIVRTPLVYGKGVKANMLSILKLVDRFPILPLAKIDNKRSFTSAENLVAFIDRIIEKKASGIFIAMDETPLSTTELVAYISRYLDKKILLFKLPNIFVRLGIFFMPTIFDRLYGSFELDNSITLQKLDFKPPFSTEEGIQKMALAYRKFK
jgi:nucleoside-diphosphate-sugar epimerase